MPSVIGQTTLLPCCGHLLLRRLHIGSIDSHFDWMVAVVRPLSLTLIKIFIDPSMYHHTFGSPCFVLDSCLQSGVGGVPKWEPQSQLEIYVGHSPSHAGSVALVLNPQMGNVSPQFHVVFNDHFTTVSFMEKNEVPPHWAQLVENSQEKVTEEHYKLAKTWLFPDPDVRGILMPESNPTNHNKSNRTSGVQETFTSSNVPSNTLPTGISSTNDASRISQQEEYLPDPLLPSVLSHDYEPSTSKDSLSIPHLINLETAGLRRSPRIAELNGFTQDGPAIVAYTSSTTQLKS
jgi:hypothetical protein